MKRCELKALAKWSALFGVAVGLFSMAGFSGLLSLILLIAAGCLIAEWRTQREAEAAALRAHEGIAIEVGRMLKRRG